MTAPRQYLIKLDARDLIPVAGTEILVSFWDGTMDTLPEAAIRHPGTQHWSPPLPVSALVTWEDDDETSRHR